MTAQAEINKNTNGNKISRRIFDCCIFNGELDVLKIRFNELNDLVDYFIVVESTITFSGIARRIAFNPADPGLRPFAAKIRHVIVADMPETNDPWVREAWQRNAVLRGLPDAAPSDLVIMSDADEIPRATAVAEMIRDTTNESFGFQQYVYYFYVNYCNVGGSQHKQPWSVAATRRRLDGISPDSLRYQVRDGREPARIFDDAGWHFSYLMDEAGIRAKIAAFSHQEFNNDAFKSGININKTVAEAGDLFGRSEFIWKVLDGTDLPAWLKENRSQFHRMFYPSRLGDRIKDRMRSLVAPAIARRRARPPAVICPYTHDHEADDIRRAFGASGLGHSLHLWQDRLRAGPAAVLEQCRTLAPDRDVVIVNAGLAPLDLASPPGTSPRSWFDALCGHRDALPNAGMIGCNLFSADDPGHVAFAGGTFQNGIIGHLHGPVAQAPATMSAALLESVRPVDWVAFGAVLIRREVIEACGSPDRGFDGSRAMEVDYGLAARLRGFRLFQVPVSFVHRKNDGNYDVSSPDHFNDKWTKYRSALPSEFDIATS
ncbi:hypothetical protein ACQW02_11760 [Humitalea sp. 24SJ18S-53]|uniref:hypothetical protein n=1 Tax=Humitalea sp. 24SJ18S-53 TaxID=3422307 RepID=UPI003D675F95